jgi:flavin-dependent dehydrogenase
VANDNQAYQVIIIGGGPAGIATSLSLSSRGISNCVVESDSIPKAKSGEAIPPNAKPLLKKMGIMHLVNDPKHTVYYGNKSCWGTSELEQKEFIQGIYGHGYLLDRFYFEQQLREHLKSHSAPIKEGVQFRKVLETSYGVEVLLDNGGQPETIHAKYIVDATGRKASVCRQLGISKVKMDHQFAITLHLSLSQEIEHEVLIEATENGWWYAAPQHDKELTIMFFTLLELLPNKYDIKSFIQRELANSIHLSKIIQVDTFQYDQIKIMPTGTSRLDVPYGKNWIAVGDAAFSYDPISSYGITSALASGFYAGHALAASLLDEKDAMAAYRYVMETTFDTYIEKLKHQYAQENRWENSIYWKNRFKT